MIRNWVAGRSVPDYSESHSSPATWVLLPWHYVNHPACLGRSRTIASRILLQQLEYSCHDIMLTTPPAYSTVAIPPSTYPPTCLLLHNLHLYPTSCVILHERTVHAALRRYKVIIKSIIFFPHYLNDTANLFLQWLTSFSSWSILPPPPYAFIYMQDPASSLSSYSFYAYIESKLTALSSLRLMYLTKPSYSLVTYTTNSNIQAIWNDEVSWMKKINTKASTRTDHKKLILNGTLYYIHTSHCVHQYLSCVWCLRWSATFTIRVPAYSYSVYLLLLLLRRDHQARTSLLCLHDPSYCTSSCCDKVATVLNIYLYQSPFAQRRNNMCLYSLMVTKVLLFWGAWK